MQQLLPPVPALGTKLQVLKRRQERSLQRRRVLLQSREPEPGRRSPKQLRELVSHWLMATRPKSQSQPAQLEDLRGAPEFQLLSHSRQRLQRELDSQSLHWLSVLVPASAPAPTAFLFRFHLQARDRAGLDRGDGRFGLSGSDGCCT